MLMEMAREMESNTGYNQQELQHQNDEQPNNDCQMNVGRNVLEELKAERNALEPSFLHCVRLLDKGLIPIDYIYYIYIIIYANLAKQ